MAGPRQVKAKTGAASSKGARVLVVEARYYEGIADTLLSGVKRVLDEAGARLFLEPQAASILDDKTLDVAAQPDGAVHFAVVDQPS